MRNPSLKEIINSLPEGRDKTFWISLWIRNVSFSIAWLSIRLKLSANQITYISIVIGLAASYMTSFHGHIGAIIGAILFNLWLILDCTDGNVARIMKSTGGYGEFVDAVGGYIVVSLGIFSTGLNAVTTESIILPQEFEKYDFVSLGAIAAICLILNQLIYQKHVNVSDNISNKKQSISKDGKFTAFAKNMNLQLGFSGLFMPLIIICSITSNMFIIPLFYFFFYSTSLIILTIKYFWEIEN